MANLWKRENAFMYSQFLNQQNKNHKNKTFTDTLDKNDRNASKLSSKVLGFFDNSVIQGMSK